MDPSLSLAGTRYRKRVIARAITCGLLLVLPSCHIPKLRQAGVGLDLPASFNGVTSADSSAQLRVDEFYGDPVLTGLVCQALATNQELKILEEEVQVASAEIRSRRGAFLPLVGLRAGAGWDRNSAFTPLGAAEKELEYRPGKHFPATPGDSLLGLNFLIPLDIWRELRNARDAAVQRYHAAIERRSDFVTRMVADIAENYYELMALDKRLETLDQTIALQEQSLAVAQKNFAAGRATDLPVQRFQAEVSRPRFARTRAKN
jgi:outer membrane protein TolC